MVRGPSLALSLMGVYYLSLGGIQLRNMSIDSHTITKFKDINFIEIEEGKLLIENREIKKGIFRFYFLNMNSFLGKLDTLMKILEHIENI